MRWSWFLGLLSLATLCVAGIYWATSSYGLELADIRDIVTIVGVVVGGGWALNQLARTRELYPRVNLDVRVWRWEQHAGYALVRVVVQIQNTGRVSLHVGDAKLWLQLLDPATPDAISSVQGLATTVSNRVRTPLSVGSWPLLAERHIKYYRWQRVVEAGEVDEIYFDFLIEEPAKAVIVYGFVGKRYGRQKILRREPLGWEIEKIYRVTEGDSDEDRDEGRKREREAPEH